MTAAVLAVDSLAVDYGPVRVLRDVSFSVGAGELVAVIGPNGAGKSTLFKAITGAVAHEGVVELGGRHCHHHRDRLGAAYIPQHSDVDLRFPITVGDLVLGGRRRFLRVGQRRRPIDRRTVEDCLDRVDLADVERRPIWTLSGGEVQRAFIARALAQEAHVLLLDEALSGIDRPRTEHLLSLFTELCASGTTLLVATHDLSLARRSFDRCLAINTRLVADGPPQVALADASLEATFGTPVDLGGGR